MRYERQNDVWKWPSIMNCELLWMSNGHYEWSYKSENDDQVEWNERLWTNNGQWNEMWNAK